MFLPFMHMSTNLILYVFQIQILYVFQIQITNEIIFFICENLNQGDQI